MATVKPNPFAAKDAAASKPKANPFAALTGGSASPATGKTLFGANRGNAATSGALPKEGFVNRDRKKKRKKIVNDRLDAMKAKSSQTSTPPFMS